MIEVWICSLSTILICLILLLETSKPSYANGQQKAVHRSCDRDSDCNSSAGEMCYWMYDGCSRGQCMCDPYTHTEGPSGGCRKARLGDEYCKPGDLCPKGMTCLNNRCSCIRGHMTADLQYCILSHEALLGEKCEQMFTKCLHKASYGYTENDVFCSYRNECECDEGYRPDGISCRKWGIGEYGCLRAFHCEGGAVCDDRRCICPNGYHATASHTKCAKRGALTNLPVGAVCDEINEKRYCAHGLVCHKCDGQRKSICVKFLLDTRWARQTGGSSHLSSGISFLLIALAVSYRALHGVG